MPRIYRGVDVMQNIITAYENYKETTGDNPITLIILIIIVLAILTINMKKKTKKKN